MNFYKLYIGDYQRDTAHLSITEHGAYMLMLQHYYATERPLPIGKALHRMLRAQDKAERDAIDAVAAQFWRTTDAGLVNDRADKEIGKAATQAEANRATAQAREAARRAAREANEQSTNRATTGQRNHSHSQTPEEGRAATSPPSPARAHADDEPPEVKGHSPTPAGLACRAMREAGLAATNPGDPRLLALLEQGATVEEFAGLAAEAVDGGKGFAWVLAALQGRRADAAAIALAPKVPDAASAAAAAAVEQTRRYLASQRQTPEERAASEAARRKVMGLRQRQAAA